MNKSTKYALYALWWLFILWWILNTVEPEVKDNNAIGTWNLSTIESIKEEKKDIRDIWIISKYIDIFLEEWNIHKEWKKTLHAVILSWINDEEISLFCYNIMSNKTNSIIFHELKNKDSSIVWSCILSEKKFIRYNK